MRRAFWGWKCPANGWTKFCRNALRCVVHVARWWGSVMRWTCDVLMQGWVLSVLSPECVLSNSVYLQGVYIYYIILDVHYTLASNKKYFFKQFSRVVYTRRWSDSIIFYVRFWLIVDWLICDLCVTVCACVCGTHVARRYSVYMYTGTCNTCACTLL